VDLAESTLESWQFLGELKDVKMYKKVGRSGMTFVKGVGTVDSPARSILKLIRDISITRVIDTQFVNGRIIEQLDNRTEILHLVFEYRPFILKAKRDFCIVRHWFRRKDGAYIMAGRSVQHPLCPPARWVNREDVLPSGPRMMTPKVQ